eukprot:COSAG03_NODE_40_length_17307_cov_3.149457_6_plen_138_part_00
MVRAQSSFAVALSLFSTAASITASAIDAPVLWVRLRSSLLGLATRKDSHAPGHNFAGPWIAHGWTVSASVAERTRPSASLHTQEIDCCKRRRTRDVVCSASERIAIICFCRPRYSPCVFGACNITTAEAIERINNWT